MNLGQFKKQTEGLPDSMELFIGERTTDFAYGLVETVQVKEIPFSEEPGGKALSRDKVIVISEEI